MALSRYSNMIVIIYLIAIWSGI